MALRIHGTVTVAAPPEKVYPLLFDAAVWRRMIGRIPGIGLERFERISESEYDATALISVAMIKGRYEGKVSVLEQRPCEYLKLSIQGSGAGNRASGQAVINLRALGNTTELAYDGQGSVSGPLASAGQRLVDTIGRQFIDQGAQARAAELAGAQTRAAPPAPRSAVPARALPSWTWAAGAAALAVALIILYLAFR